MKPFARCTELCVVAATTFTLAACNGGPATTSSNSTGTAVSSSAATASSSPSSTRASGARSVDAMHNDADVTFAQMMIVHHEGAIEMANLAATRVGGQQVKDLAAKIKAAQAPEIEQMRGWLQAWGAGMGTYSMPNTTSTPADMGGIPATDPASTDSSGSSASSARSGDMQMPGMTTTDRMSELTSTSGTDFDRLFLRS